MFDLKNKIAVVTGSARGLGQAIAIKLASAGASIALCDLELDWLTESEELIKKIGVDVKSYSVNVADSNSVIDGIKKIESDFGKIDILVNNAGITKDGLLIRMSEDDWDQVLDVNLKGVFLCTKAVMRGMSKRREGSIVNIASVIGLMGNAGQANYAASKAGIVAFSKSLSIEYAKKNININCVSPGFIKTEMTDKINEEFKKVLISKIPSGDLGTGEDVSNCVAFLASDMAKYINGETIHVNGGMYMS